MAERWHLGSEESFTRAFKAAYGITPRAARAVALTTRDGGPASDGATSELSRWMRNMGQPLQSRPCRDSASARSAQLQRVFLLPQYF